MKKVKISIALLALVITVGFSAFTSEKNENHTPKLDQQWYNFVGGDPNNPLDYEVHMGLPPTCNSGTIRCAVKAEPSPEWGSDYPNLDDPSIDIRNKP